MTTQYAVLPARSGRSYTAKLFAVSDLTTEITVTSITVSELAVKGLFRAAIVKPAVVAAGDYVLSLLWNSTGAAVGYFTFAGTDGETATETAVLAELDSASVSAVQSGLATSSSVSTLQVAVDAITAIFTGMTSLPNWLRRALRKDSGTAGMTTAQTEINNTGGAFAGTTDSLEAIRDNSGGASLEDIISGVQSVSGAIVEAQNSATLSIRIGDTWTQDIGSLGDLTGKTVSFAMKKRASDADTAAIVFITEGTGLTRLNGAATTAGWGSITINDEVAGDITLRLESDATSLLTSGSYVDAVKLLEDGDDRSPRNAGRTVVSAGVIADIT